MRERLVVISPVYNEAANIERTVRAVARQTRPPDLWLVVDDGSDDETLALLRRLEPSVPFMRVLEGPPRSGSDSGSDPLTAAKEASAFLWALGTLDALGFDVLGKLDGDIEPAPGHFEYLLDRFAEDPALGITGSNLLEPASTGWKRLRVPSYHVHGAVKLYRRSCWEAIGGIQPRLGWDSIDETYARMNGFRTRSFPDVSACHHRPWASANGTLRGRARHGEATYIVHYGLAWAVIRAAKLSLARPAGLSGVAYLYGYVRAMLTGVQRVEDDAFRRHVRRELRTRLRSPSGRLVAAPRTAGRGLSRPVARRS